MKTSIWSDGWSSGTLTGRGVVTSADASTLQGLRVLSQQRSKRPMRSLEPSRVFDFRFKVSRRFRVAWLIILTCSFYLREKNKVDPNSSTMSANLPRNLMQIPTCPENEESRRWAVWIGRKEKQKEDPEVGSTASQPNRKLISLASRISFVTSASVASNQSVARRKLWTTT